MNELQRYDISATCKKCGINYLKRNDSQSSKLFALHASYVLYHIV